MKPEAGDKYKHKSTGLIVRVISTNSYNDSITVELVNDFTGIQSLKFFSKHFEEFSGGKLSLEEWFDKHHVSPDSLSHNELLVLISEYLEKEKELNND